MAKITGPLLGLGASGSIAKTLVASKWKGRPYMRQHVIPANPQTVAQTLTRDAFGMASNIWKLMGVLGIAPWDRFAVGQVLTGRNKMQGNYVTENRGETDLLSWNMSPGAKGGIPPLTLVLSSPGVNDIEALMTTPAPPTGWTLSSKDAMAIRDQDPQTGVLFETTEATAAPGFEPLLPGLTTAVLYVVGGWLRWAKPDGSIAYSVALQGTFTPTP